MAPNVANLYLMFYKKTKVHETFEIFLTDIIVNYKYCSKTPNKVYSNIQLGFYIRKKSYKCDRV